MASYVPLEPGKLGDPPAKPTAKPKLTVKSGKDKPKHK